MKELSKEEVEEIRKIIKKSGDPLGVLDCIREKMLDKTIALNDEVREELKKDFELFCCYVLKYGYYDSEIDPLHNPNYRATQSRQEKEDLIKTKAKMAELRIIWDDLVEGKYK